MADQFSGVVKLGNVNDYIAPSQSCVVNLGSIPRKLELGEKTSGTVIPHKKNRVSREEENLGPVKITLHDCLACSGCVTSAETVLLEQQSVDEFISQLKSKKKAVIVSISPQSRAALATYYGLPLLQTFKKLTSFFKGLGVRAVFDTSFSRDVSLLESLEEFIARFESKGEGSLPMLASSCPGWVCYAEKTHGSHILPYISTAKSPQQTMGSVIKRFACHELGLRPEEVYHVTVMPCYDKKLEASREDFIFSLNADDPDGPSTSMAEVDCVLTSGEIYDLLQSQGANFSSLEEASLDRMLSSVDEQGHLFGARGGSGGYAEFIFRQAAQRLFGKVFNGPLQFKTLRNSDFTELSLEVDGRKVLNVACAYGFRNIQNVVRKIKSGKCEYHFVEVMACPVGCLNGGGQVKPPEGTSQKDFLREMESVYLKEVYESDPSRNPLVKGLYANWLGFPYSETARKVLHTQYHEREKTVGSLIANW